MQENFFSYAGLRKFLNYISKNYKVMTLKEWREGPGIIMRHDVDLSLEPAFKVYKIEKELGVHSSFFVMVTSPTYNPLSRRNRKILKKMASDGFEVGLHFDLLAYGEVDSKAELKGLIDAEAAVISTASGSPVDSISFHNPSTIGNLPLPKGYRNAYDPTMFSDSNYISDSCMEFRGKDIYEFVEKSKNSMIQVLLHPFHYVGGSYITAFKEYLNSMVDSLDKTFGCNHAYRKELKGRNLGEVMLLENKP